MGSLGGDDACEHNYSTYTNKTSMLLNKSLFPCYFSHFMKKGRDLIYVLFFRESGAKLLYI